MTNSSDRLILTLVLTTVVVSGPVLAVVPGGVSESSGGPQDTSATSIAAIDERNNLSEEQVRSQSTQQDRFSTRDSAEQSIQAHDGVYQNSTKLLTPFFWNEQAAENAQAASDAVTPDYTDASRELLREIAAEYGVNARGGGLLDVITVGAYYFRMQRQRDVAQLLNADGGGGDDGGDLLGRRAELEDALIELEDNTDKIRNREDVTDDGEFTTEDKRQLLTQRRKTIETAARNLYTVERFYYVHRTDEFDSSVGANEAYRSVRSVSYFLYTILYNDYLATESWLNNDTAKTNLAVATGGSLPNRQLEQTERGVVHTNLNTLGSPEDYAVYRFNISKQEAGPNRNLKLVLTGQVEGLEAYAKKGSQPDLENPASDVTRAEPRGGNAGKRIVVNDDDGLQPGEEFYLVVQGPRRASFTLQSQTNPTGIASWSWLNNAEPIDGKIVDRYSYTQNDASAGVAANNSLATNDVSSGASIESNPDWPMAGDGPSNTMDNSESAGPTANVTTKWKQHVGVYVSSSPAVVDGTVYATSNRPDRTDPGLYALDAQTGEEQWTQQRSSGKSSPAVRNGTVYVGGEGVVSGLGAETGEEQWTYSVSGYAGSPTVVDGTVYIGSTDGTLYALDAKTGERQWTFDTDGATVRTPAVTDGAVYIATESGSVYALNRKGQLQWSDNFDQRNDAPVVANGTVFIGGDNVFALNAQTGRQEWKFDRGHFEAPPAVSNGTVYIGSNTAVMYALDAQTGDQKWKFNSSNGDRPILASISTLPAVVGETVYFSNGRSDIYALDTQSGEKLWKESSQFDRGKTTLGAALAVTNGTLYIGTEGYDVPYTRGGGIRGGDIVAIEETQQPEQTDRTSIIPSLKFSPSKPSAGETVRFNTSLSSTPIDDIDEFRWDFDSDGRVDATTSNPTANHSYQSPGSYEARVIVTGSEVHSSEVRTTVRVVENTTGNTTTGGSNNSGPVVQPDSQVLVNPTFENNLDGWQVTYNDPPNQTRGNAIWSSQRGGSARMSVSGAPSNVIIYQETGQRIPVGTELTINLATSGGLSCCGGVNLRLDGTQVTGLTHPADGPHEISYITKQAYPAGTRFAIRTAIWPGKGTAHVANISWSSGTNESRAANAGSGDGVAEGNGGGPTETPPPAISQPTDEPQNTSTESNDTNSRGETDAERFLVASTTTDADLTYRFLVDGTVRLIREGDRSADAEESITKNDNGTVTVTGRTGDQVGDSFRIAGEIRWFEKTGGSSGYRLEMAGDDVTNRLTRSEPVPTESETEASDGATVTPASDGTDTPEKASQEDTPESADGSSTDASPDASEPSPTPSPDGETDDRSTANGDQRETATPVQDSETTAPPEDEPEDPVATPTPASETETQSTTSTPEADSESEAGQEGTPSEQETEEPADTPVPVSSEDEPDQGDSTPDDTSTST